VLWLEDGCLYLRLRNMSQTILLFMLPNSSRR
jgi:hypothetical protein